MSKAEAFLHMHKHIAYGKTSVGGESLSMKIKRAHVEYQFYMWMDKNSNQ
jgi:hypothetical protein